MQSKCTAVLAHGICKFQFVLDTDPFYMKHLELEEMLSCSFFVFGSLSRAVSLQQLTYGNVSPIQTSTSPLFRGMRLNLLKNN